MNKKPWKSKTLWMAAVMALAPLLPPVGVWVTANPELASLVVSGLFAGLRFVTNGKIALED